MFEQRDIDNLNEDISNWNDKNKNDILNEMDVLGIKHSSFSPNKTPLRKALKSKLRKRFDLINKISYSMPRSAVFLHKGVSRGHGKDNPRQAKEWFNPVVDKNIDDLAERVADGQGNLVVNALKIK
jgi:hypothetical protein